MLDPTGLYDSPRLAAGYAFARPPVHARVIELLATRLGRAEPVARALDVGCGAGLSTGALQGVARGVVGLEPSLVMLRHHAATAPRALFVNGRAEDLPFADATFDMVTAAGALNYVDLARFLPAVARVLAAGGVFVIYDFSSGRRARDDGRLSSWFAEFERRYPFPPGYDLDVQAVDYASAGLHLDTFVPFEVALEITAEAYLDYVLTESNVERAVTSGAAERDVRIWCERTLGPIFDERPLEVVFEGYIALIRRG